MSFWSTEHSLSALLALLVIQSFIVAPLSAGHHVIPELSDILFSLILLAGLLTITKRRITKLLSQLFVATTIGLHWALFFAPSRTLLLTDRVFTLIFAIALTAFVLHEVYRSGAVTAHRIRGSIAAYLLLGYVFSVAYGLLDLIIPGALSINPLLDQPGANQADIFMYFSIVTLTTIGFGDVTAVHPMARSLVMLEGLIGTLYPAVLIARLVSLQIAGSREK